MLGGLFYGPQILLQGQTGSLVDKTAGYIPGMKANPSTDIGKRLGDVLGSWLTAPAKVGGAGGRLGSNFSPRQVPGLPTDYKQTELQAGAAAEAYRPGAGFPGQQQFPGAPVDPLSRLSPQDRAYQQERARVEAMVKSNPDMQKEEIAAARAKVRDQGMEAWAKANPELAAKVMPGQSGFSAIQGFVGGVGAPTTGPASAALQASPELNPASPTFVGGEGAPILRDLTPELIKQYQEQLLKQAK
jgi:hypothetical protein